MDNMHPLMQQCLAGQPHMPPPQQALNDDDVYVVNLRTNTVVQQYGAASASAQCARAGGLPVKLGQGLFTGMQARMLGVLQ